MAADIPFEITLDTWIISDTHFFHENIGRYCNRPNDWQDMIIENWNRLISPEEVVFHLGDFALGKKSNFEWLVSNLNGKILLIRGNHDRLSRTYYEAHRITLVHDPVLAELKNGIRLAFSHRPMVPLEEGLINLHGHIHNNPPPPEGSTLGPYHLNMSIEVRDYRPWRLGELLKLKG